MAKRNGLGRGLDALINKDIAHDSKKLVAKELDLDLIEVNPSQPRQNFDSNALEELAESINKIGVIQPITVRKTEEDRYQIIAGERRFRASKLANKKRIPAWIREVDNEEVLQIAIVENLQREDLDPIEIGLSFRRLLDECSLSQDELSHIVGKKRPTITNYLRLLKLPYRIQKGLQENLLQMGHAKALMGLNTLVQQEELYDKIVDQGLSVRKVEEIVKQWNSEKKEKKVVEKNSALEHRLTEAKNLLNSMLSSNIECKSTPKGKGKIVIPFKNPEDLERILGIFGDLNS